MEATTKQIISSTIELKSRYQNIALTHSEPKKKLFISLLLGAFLISAGVSA